MWSPLSRPLGTDRLCALCGQAEYGEPGTYLAKLADPLASPAAAERDTARMEWLAAQSLRGGIIQLDVWNGSAVGPSASVRVGHGRILETLEACDSSDNALRAAIDAAMAAPHAEGEE